MSWCVVWKHFSLSLQISSLLRLRFCLYRSVYQQFCLSVSPSLSLSIASFFCPVVSFSVCLSVSLSVCLSVCLSVSRSLRLSLALSLSPSDCLVVSLSLCLAVSLSLPSVSPICLSFFLSPSLCLWLSVPLSLCLVASLPLCLPLSLSLCLSRLMVLAQALTDPDCIQNEGKHHDGEASIHGVAGTARAQSSNLFLPAHFTDSKKNHPAVYLTCMHIGMSHVTLENKSCRT